MKISPKAEAILKQIKSETTKLGDLRAIAKDIKKDHQLALELWSSTEYLPRQLAILIMDKKLLSKDFIEKLVDDIQMHTANERLQLIDWLMANQLTKDKSTVALMESWEDSNSALLKRVFWYYQGRLRWMGNTPPPNTDHLLASVETKMADESPEVQWAMNFTTAQIGIHQAEYRSKCIALGEYIGLYKDEIVSRGCTPNYLPDYISTEVNKLQNKSILEK